MTSKFLSKCMILYILLCDSDIGKRCEVQKHFHTIALDPQTDFQRWVGGYPTYFFPSKCAALLSSRMH